MIRETIQTFADDIVKELKARFPQLDVERVSARHVVVHYKAPRQAVVSDAPSWTRFCFIVVDDAPDAAFDVSITLSRGGEGFHIRDARPSDVGRRLLAHATHTLSRDALRAVSIMRSFGVEFCPINGYVPPADTISSASNAEEPIQQETAP